METDMWGIGTNMFMVLLQLITALILLFTIREMRKQRKAAYTPEIVLEHKKYGILQDESLENQFLNIGWIEATGIEGGKEAAHGKIVLDAYNIGNGSATNCIAEWNINFDLLLKRIKELDLEKEFKVRCESNNQIEIYHLGKYHYLSTISNQLKINKEFIYPVSVKQDAWLIPMPDFFVMLLNIMVHLEKYNHGIPLTEINRLSAVKVRLTFSDVNSVCYSKNYKVQIRPYLSVSATEKSGVISVALETHKLL